MSLCPFQNASKILNWRNYFLAIFSITLLRGNLCLAANSQTDISVLSALVEPHLEHSVDLLWYFVIWSPKILFWFILSKLRQKSPKFDFQNSVCMIFNWSKQGTFTKPIKLTSAEAPCFESTKRACTTLFQKWMDFT